MQPTGMLYCILNIGGPSARLYILGGHVPPPPILEISIGQAKNSNSSNGGAPLKILAVTLCPPKISGLGPPMILNANLF